MREQEKDGQPRHAAEHESPPRTRPGPEPQRGTGSAYTPKPDFAPKPRRSGLWLALCAGAVALGVAVGSFRMMQAPASPPSSGAPAAVAADKQERMFMVALKDLDAAATQKAREALLKGQVPAELALASPAVRDAVRDGSMGLFTVRLFDAMAEDGDAVDVAVDGKTLGRVMLDSSGSVLTLPLKPGKEQTLQFTAVIDGGGGVTFGAQSSVDAVHTRVMAVGESEVWNIGFK